MEMVYIDDIKGRVCYNKLPLGLIILTCNLTTLKEETLPYYKVLSETVSFSSNCGLRTGWGRRHRLELQFLSTGMFLLQFLSIMLFWLFIVMFKLWLSSCFVKRYRNITKWGIIIRTNQIFLWLSYTWCVHTHRLQSCFWNHNLLK